MQSGAHTVIPALQGRRIGLTTVTRGSKHTHTHTFPQTNAAYERDRVQPTCWLNTGVSSVTDSTQAFRLTPIKTALKRFIPQEGVSLTVFATALVNSIICWRCCATSSIVIIVGTMAEVGETMSPPLPCLHKESDAGKSELLLKREENAILVRKSGQVKQTKTCRKCKGTNARVEQNLMKEW